MSIKQNYKKFWTHYFDFKGISTRREYWTPTLIHLAIFVIAILILIPTAMMDAMQHTLALVLWVVLLGALMLFALAIFIPSIAIQVRRLHDINRKGFLVYASLVASVVYNFTPDSTVKNIIDVISLILSVWVFVYTLLPSKEKHLPLDQMKWV